MPEFQRIRFYLDANVLFSASYSLGSRFLTLWRLQDATPVTSPHAILEVRNHTKRSGHAERLDSLLLKTELVNDIDPQLIPSANLIEQKDRPILSAAIGARVDYLVTGDRNHFGHLYDSAIDKVYIIAPGTFLDRNAYRLLG